MIPLEIRPARQNELAAILNLYAELEFGAESKSLDLPDAEKLWERIRRYPDYAIYVALVEGKIVGTFALLVMDNLAHLGAPSGIIEDVVVHPKWQGKGLGKQMMQFAIAKCQQAKCYKLVLSSNLKRERAHQFYLDLGFEKHGYSFFLPLLPTTKEHE
jgi:GNAT superfamily N-acetyltransferase